MTDQTEKKMLSIAPTRIEKIQLASLAPAEENEIVYKVDGIEELAASIEAVGLLQNLVVKRDETSYKVIAGNRRLAAMRHLAAQGKLEEKNTYIPCVVIDPGEDSLIVKLKLLTANATSRVLTDAERVRQYAELEDVLKQLKARGDFSGNIRAVLQEQLEETSGQLARYGAIAKNLTNEKLKEAFEAERMGVSAAYLASRLSEKEQETLAASIDDKVSITMADIEAAKETEEETDHERKDDAREGNRADGARQLPACQDDREPGGPSYSEDAAGTGGNERGDGEDQGNKIDYATIRGRNTGYEAVMWELTELRRHAAELLEKTRKEGPSMNPSMNIEKYRVEVEAYSHLIRELKAWRSSSGSR